MKVRVILCLLYCIIQPLNFCSSDNADKWIEELSTTDTSYTLSVYDHRFGQRYLRGFPKGIWGTHQLPSLSVNNADEQLWMNIDVFYEVGVPVVEAYKIFKRSVRKRFCETEQRRLWTCCKKVIKRSGCDSVPPKAKAIMDVLIDPLHHMPMVFLYNWCLLAWKSLGIHSTTENNTWLKVIKKTCPNPCFGNPCRSIQHVKPAFNCRILGFLQDEYECECHEHFVWDTHLHTCLPINPCSLINPPCVSEGTEHCLASNDGSALCICREGSMGKDCSLRLDACIERKNKSLRIGYENCQVHLGNHCYPSLGLDHYKCDCQFGYIRSISVLEDNCLERRDPCLDYYASVQPTIGRENGSTAYIRYRGLVCLNGGRCVHSADLSRAICVCPVSSSGDPLFAGQNCEIPIGMWSAWTMSSACFPVDCGQTRYRWRRRRCLNATDMGIVSIHDDDIRSVRGLFQPQAYCPGTSEEVLPCEPLQPCMSFRFPGYIREEIWTSDSLLCLGGITLGYLLFSTILWFLLVPRIFNVDDSSTESMEVSFYKVIA
ncbi:hypothetical protein EG68_02329 [Paragonimus skrjabini miyazakii]|uniref:EGF-like domain-containing protein n=1 Tax=Paragonimus skrjabini miyazakii TaxID=59628 RepID=A0A8S9Z448_9TREM|nr:hypothetical protein EG68_02329 [Paragonimus skrjabini miyazakii]